MPGVTWLTLCHVSLSLLPQKMKKNVEKGKNSENISCKNPLWGDEWPSDVGTAFALPKYAACHILMKERVLFPEGLALPLQPALFSLPLLATGLPVLAARTE